MVEWRESVQFRDESVNPLNKPFRVPVHVCLRSCLAASPKSREVDIVLFRMLDVFWIIFEIHDFVKNGRWRWVVMSQPVEYT
jgi:hypothetical protein